MRSVPLGRTGRQIAPLAYGCMSLTREREAEGIAAVAKAYELGITCFDNADMYPGPRQAGDSERLLGEAIRAAGIPREDLVITSKCAIVFPGMDERYTFKAYDTRPAYLRERVERSLRNIGTDYLDVFFLHRIDYLVHPAELAEGLGQLQAEGKIRHVGLSNYRPDEARAVQAYLRVEVLQNEFNLVHQVPLEHGQHALCTGTGMALMAWSPLAAGALVGAGRAEVRHRDFRRQRLDGVLAQLAPIAAAYGVTAGQLALAWLMQLPGPVLPLVGTANPAHIAEAAAAAAIELRRDHWYELMVIGRGRNIPYYQEPYAYLKEH